MTIKEQVTEAMKTAMRAQDKERLAVIRLILSAFKQVEVDERIVLDETRELAILDKMQKQRRDSIEAFNQAGRAELAAKEQAEIDIIQSFMPAALSEQEISQIVSSAIAESGAKVMQDMAKVMAILKPKLQGRADIGKVGATVKSLLSK
ncbi:MAG: GatB/YqeY domain-containing protein [Proteobacteria bacterium]|nr:GatB/YqeY domain-containing protein [Pseudomonadota bacterium]